MANALSALVRKLRANQPIAPTDLKVFEELRRRSREKSIARLLAHYAIDVNECETLRHRLYLIRSEAQTYSGDLTGGLASLLMALRLRPFEHINIDGLSALWRSGIADSQLASFFLLNDAALFTGPAERIEPAIEDVETEAPTPTTPRILGDEPRALINLTCEIGGERLRGAVSVCGPCHLVVVGGFIGTIDRTGIIPNCTTRHGYILGDKVVRHHFDRVAHEEAAYAGDAALICDAFDSSNYAHWLLDWLPRLELLRLCGLTPETIIYAKSDLAFQDASLRWVLKGDERLLDVKQQHSFACSRLFIADSCFHSHMHPAHRANEWSLQFFEALGQRITAETEARRRRIYVSRQKSRRCITNHDATRSLLTAHGFEEVFLEHLSFEEQVSAFVRAEAIFGLHGAGLANLVFCRQGTRVMEVFGRFGGNGFALLACRKGLIYSAMGSTESPATSDTALAAEHVHVDLALLRIWLSDLCD